jgi:pimeloyl-ACP methyl ester carboxylesterase
VLAVDALVLRPDKAGAAWTARTAQRSGWRHWKPVPAHRVQAGGITLHWREWGQGQPLVLLHGGHGSWMHWVRNIECFARHYRVLVPDLPGFGASDDFALPAHDGQRPAALLDALSDSVVQLVGPSRCTWPGSRLEGRWPGCWLHACRRYSGWCCWATAGHGGPRRETEALLDWRVSDPAERMAALHQNLAVFMLSKAAAADALALHIHRHCCEATRFRSKAMSQQPPAGGAAGLCQADSAGGARPM